MWKRTIGSLEEHPNATEIVSVLARLPQVSDAELSRLAGGWHNTVAVADARGRALGPDTPLVLEVLAAFEASQALFAEEINGERPGSPVSPLVATTALKAIRDAIAAAYARPSLSRSDYAALMRPWRGVYGDQRLAEPDLGPESTRVKAVLALLPTLSGRCHDAAAARQFDGLASIAASIDHGMRTQARAETWRAAVLTSRRRVWGLVRRSGAEGLGRFCGRCRREAGGDEEQAVLELCLDAACALLVADAVDDALIDVLTLPLGQLLPAARTSAE